MSLADIETIIFVMMENRSFDHMLGYLGLQNEKVGLKVEGLRTDAAWIKRQANLHAGVLYPPHALPPDHRQGDDPPHDHTTIDKQINTQRPAEKKSLMGGFVDSFMTRSPTPADPSDVMGYHLAQSVPTYDFLAHNFSVCDHWFAALPCGTQPNRLMAMGGQSTILNNASVFLPTQDLVYDWLTRNAVRWCAYQSGDFLPFFALMTDWLPEIVSSLSHSFFLDTGRFRRQSNFRDQWISGAELPQVIFIEPEYTDGPHGVPNDDHPPTGVAAGQAFVADIYETLIANPDRWRNTMMIVSYDEHGGFFDHVPPLAIQAVVEGTPIATTGVRVPAFVVSPHVAKGVPFTDLLDHTSFLQLLADRFTPGKEYSPEVAARQAGLGRLSTALTRTPGAEAPFAPSIPASAAVTPLLAASPARSHGTADSEGAARTTAAFRAVAHKISTDHPDMLAGPGWASLQTFVVATAPDAKGGTNG